jgi:hypothetical protein
MPSRAAGAESSIINMLIDSPGKVKCIHCAHVHGIYTYEFSSLDAWGRARIHSLTGAETHEEGTESGSSSRDYGRLTPRQTGVNLGK